MKNFSKYVADVFRNLQWLRSSTDTAGALQRVRENDLKFTCENYNHGDFANLS